MSQHISVGNPFVASGRSCYYVKVTLTDPRTGQRRHLKKSTEVLVTAPNALSKAHQARLRILADFNENHDPGAPLTLRDFGKHYIAEREAEHLSRSSISGITRAFAEFVKYSGKGRLLQDLSVTDVRSFVFKYLKNPAMAVINYRYLHAAFARAVRDGLIGANPFDQIDKHLLKKRFKPRPRGILSPKDVMAIYETMPKTEFCDATFANYFLLLFGGALRRGEACYLTTRDVDLAASTIIIRPSEVHRLKNAASEGAILMTSLARTAIESQLKLKRLHSKEEVRESEYIFCNRLGFHYYPDSLTKQVIRRVKLAARSLGIRTDGFDLHSLRHSMIQHLIDSGTDPVVVAKFARHANLSTTLSAYHKMRDSTSGFDQIEKLTRSIGVYV
ncbi:MAG: site-specific integrase [Bacteroidetes bacterium]|nr:site-specific integrase [Bacteroidota bacterium]